MGIIVRNVDGLNCPIVVCDYCGKDIKEHKEANYEWWDDGDSDNKIYYFHKKCCLNVSRIGV